MKRGAEKQMSKDDDSDEEIQEISEGQGFRKADDSVLATRSIRALPRRSMAGTPPPSATNGTTTPNVSTPPRLGGFSGFGFPTSNNSSFTFTPPATVNNTPRPGASSLSSFSSFNAPPPSNTPVASTASNTAKTFASFLTASSQSSSSTKGSTEADTSTIASPASKYYVSLRGLNVSFISAISKAAEDDPFIDMADIINRYKDLRLEVQKEFDDSASNSSRQLSVTPAKAPTMPIPPAKFSGFGSSTSSTSSTPTTLGSGFVPKPTSNSTSTPSAGFTFPPTATSIFGSNSFAAQSTPPFGTPSSEPSTSLFGNTTASSFAPSPFGTSSQKLSSETSSSMTTSTLPANPFVTTDKSAPSNLFGGPATPSAAAKPSPFGFSNFSKSTGASGSIGNPVGFTFANPSKPDSNNTSNSSSSEPAGMSETAKIGSGGATSNGGETGNQKTVGDDSNFGLMANNPHDEEGEGEEDEETIHAIKLKAYRMKKAEEKGGQGWVELGHGVLRLKKHKGTDARRMLLRNSSTGKININFNIYAGLKPSQAKKAITFVGHDNGTAQTYSVRLQNDEQAAALKDVIDREVEFVKAKFEG
ncbi:hypothetical protein BD779DRAFT_1798006 [Infundibulicybe gibba]|nr:hypothetical protein BD779DRAFT_1798006 [Infundibulicybe gibba]